MKDSDTRRCFRFGQREEKESVDPVGLMLVIDTTDSMTRESIGVPIDMAGAARWARGRAQRQRLRGRHHVFRRRADACGNDGDGDKPVLDAINSIKPLTPTS
ncbi:MAG: hypothetical protein ACLS7Z_03705 [Christensenellales bacterium]